MIVVEGESYNAADCLQSHHRDAVTLHYRVVVHLSYTSVYSKLPVCADLSNTTTSTTEVSVIHPKAEASVWLPRRSFCQLHSLQR